MAVQLALELESPQDDWRLDDHTREIGRRGVAEARRALARARVRPAPDAPSSHDRPAAA